jgi:hypothetical protein
LNSDQNPTRHVSLTDPDRVLLRLEYEVLHLAHVKRPALESSDAHRHLLEGFLRRLMMMQACRLEIDDLAPPEGGPPLDTDLAVLLSVYLNAFYLNLCGALDNLAWMLKYEWGLLADASEDNPERRNCSLFGKAFLREVRNQQESLADLLLAHDAWNQSLRDLRDPGAHRIPLHATAGVLPTDRLADVKSKEEAALAAIERDESALPYLAEARSIASYLPIFVLSDPDGLSVRSLPGQVAADHRHFLEIAAMVVSAL